MTNATAAHPRTMACRFGLYIDARQRSAAGSRRPFGLVDSARKRRLGIKCSCGCLNTCTSVTAMDVWGEWRRSKQGGLKATKFMIGDCSDIAAMPGLRNYRSSGPRRFLMSE